MSQVVAQPDTKPLIGLVEMPEAEYHAHPALSNSGIGHILKSPAHYMAQRLCPRVPTPAMALGTAAHRAILEPERFYQTYVACPSGIDRRTKAGREAWESLIESHPGKEILSIDDYQRTEAMVMAVHSHPTASKLLTGGRAEQSLFWVDKKTGVHCRSRIDYLREDGLVVDVKTTRCASAASFVKSVGQFGYHRQGAMYLEGGEAALKEKQIAFIFIAVESEPPYGIGVFALDEMAIAIGHREFEKGCELFALCKKTDTWPGYPEAVQTISLPTWAIKEFDGFE